MINELTLFPENQNSLEQELKQNPLYNLAHPYSRYGLAVALVRLDKWMSFEEVETASKKDLIEILIQEIESGLNNFRFETFDNPETAEELRFVSIKLEKLRQDKSLVQGKLSEIGKYLVPTIVTTDGDAKNTFENAEKIINDLRNGEELSSIYILSRSFAPTTSKINNGVKSQRPPETTLFEATCSIITAVTEIKPASWIATRNTVIIPDLPLGELKGFVELFSAMLSSDANSNQLTAKVKKAKESNLEKIDNKKTKFEYQRPPIFSGNYPFAPRNSAFGAVGLLAAIGRWAVRAEEENWAEKVLKSLEGKPLYVISYDKIFQVQFSHHIINLAIKDKLSILIDKIAFETQLYSEIESKENRWKSTNYQLFDLMTNRFLQLFDKPTFQDFLAFRAEYALEVSTLFEEYFMKDNTIDRKIVESAKAYGQWLNLTAFLIAKEENEKTKGSYQDLIKQKAKVLIGFESAVMSGETPQDMLHRISTQAGRLLQSDAPAEATKFMDAVMCGDVSAKTAQHMLIAYMRLRTEKEKTETN
jgi:hypothetical protein